jgi:hypothetical protein
VLEKANQETNIKETANNLSEMLTEITCVKRSLTWDDNIQMDLRAIRRLSGRYVNGNGSGSCPVMVYGTFDTESSSSCT